MFPKRICVQDLNTAIALSNQLKIDIKQGKQKQAIDRISDLLFTMGRALTCINQAEFARSLTTKAAPAATRATRALATRRTTNAKNTAECLRLVNLAIANFKRARTFVQLGRYEDAENVIAATLTGKILRCVNHLRG